MRRSQAGWEVLLLRRSEQQGGFWQGISGKVESEDADLRAAVAREVQEEAGWRLVPATPVTALGAERVFRGYDSLWYRKRSFLVALDSGGSTPPILSDEHVAYLWAPLDEAASLVDLEVYREELRSLAKALAD